MRLRGDYFPDGKDSHLRLCQYFLAADCTVSVIQTCRHAQVDLVETAGPDSLAGRIRGPCGIARNVRKHSSGNHGSSVGIRQLGVFHRKGLRKAQARTINQPRKNMGGGSWGANRSGHIRNPLLLAGLETDVIHESQSDDSALAYIGGGRYCR